jgi:hypothetical protein
MGKIGTFNKPRGKAVDLRMQLLTTRYVSTKLAEEIWPGKVSPKPLERLEKIALSQLGRKGEKEALTINDLISAVSLVQVRAGELGKLLGLVEDEDDPNLNDCYFAVFLDAVEVHFV